MARESAGQAAPRYARPFVLLFLATLVVCAAAGLNLWPFSSWELFSRLRTDQAAGWDALAVDSAGRTRDDPIPSLPYGHRGFGATMAMFHGDSPSARDAICDTWLNEATRRLGSSTRELKIYRLHWLVSERGGPRRRKLVVICRERSA
jgi:hypothetical protein